MGAAKAPEYFGSRHSDAGLSGNIGLVGQSGTGKTYRAQQLLKKVRRGIFFDTAANVGSGPRQNPMPGWTELWGMDAFVTYMRRYRGGNFRVVYHPGGDAKTEFDGICKLAMEIKNVVLMVDEVWEFCKASWMPESLQRLAFRGRHAGVTLMWTAQRPARVAYDLRSQASSIYAFRVQRRLDVDAMAEVLPDAAVPLLKSLPDRAYIYRDEQENWKQVRG